MQISRKKIVTVDERLTTVAAHKNNEFFRCKQKEEKSNC